jgi:hypothetical protein
LNTALPSTAASDARISGLELWLRSAWRRQVLLLGCVAVLTALSSRMWIQASAGFGPELDWYEIVGRRFIDWSLWALLFEPIAWLARMSMRLSRFWVVLIAIHVPLSMGVARVVVELDDAITDSVFEPIQWPQDWQRNDDRQQTARDGDEVASANESLTPQVTPQAGGGRQERRDRFKGWRRGAGMMIYWVILGLAGSISTFLRNREQERISHRLALRASRLEKELVGAQLGNLKNQLHPHFLFNALHSVGGLIRENENQVALSALSNLGGLLRTILERGKRQEVTLVDELELLDKYLEIEKMRLGDRLEATTSLEPGLGNTRLPSLVLLPLVENAIKHGIAPRTEGGKIEISAWRKDGKVFIEICDDGPGFLPGVLDDGLTPPPIAHTPIGLENTWKRMETMYASDGGMQISNRDEGGACVLLWVPDRQAVRTNV